MNGRHLLYRCLIWLSCVSLLIHDAKAQQQPNIVIILADDLDAVITPRFFPEVLPTLDSLKKTGIDFSNAFTPMSICCPSRAALLSGQYAHNTKVYRNGGEKGGWDDFKDNEPLALPAFLSKAGYRTAMIGKYLNGYEIHKKKLPPVPYGWTDGAVFVDPLMGTYKGYDYNLMVWSSAYPVNDSIWDAPDEQIQKFGKEPADYSTDVLTEKAKAYIMSTEKNDNQPFFLYLTPTPPHFPIPYAPRHETKTIERWLNDTIPTLPNTFNDYGNLASSSEIKRPLDKPSWLHRTWKKRIRQQDKGDFYYDLMFEGKVPRSIKSFSKAEWFYRMGSLYALDDMIREVIQVLKKNGEWENTLLIISSDNGYQLGNHALRHKGTPYEESIRVPMVIDGGMKLNMKHSSVIDDWIINLDLMPTLLELARIPLPELHGKSFLPLIRNPGGVYDSRDNFIMEYIGPGMTTDFIARHPKLIFRIVPSYVLDHPSFNAIRIKTTVIQNGKNSDKILKYIEWEKYPGHFRFRKKLENNDEKLLSKLSEGKKRVLRMKEKVEAVETELYDVTNDPFELDNLLYYKPEEYRPVADELKRKLQEEIRR